MVTTGMRVLHVLHSIERSGAEQMLTQAAPLFREHGLELHAVATGESVGAYAQRFAAAGFTIHHLPLSSSASHLRRFYELLRTLRIDVVHVHTERAFFWYELVARLAGVKRIVRTVHGVFEFRGRLWAERWLERRLAATVLGAISVAPGPSVAEAEAGTYGVHPLQILNWTDCVRFSPPKHEDDRNRVRERLGIPLNAVVLISVGSCQHVKNHAAIVRALPSVAQACPEVHYLHVGSGELETAEQALASELGVRESVSFVGQRDDVSDLLAASDVFVMPSTREGFAISCLEAMSSGLPVVGRETSGLRDLIVDGVTGRLVRSEEEFVRELETLCTNRQLRLRFGQAGRRRAENQFSMEASAASYLRLYTTGVLG